MSLLSRSRLAKQRKKGSNLLFEGGGVFDEKPTHRWWGQCSERCRPKVAAAAFSSFLKGAVFRQIRVISFEQPLVGHLRECLLRPQTATNHLNPRFRRCPEIPQGFPLKSSQSSRHLGESSKKVLLEMSLQS